MSAERPQVIHMKRLILLLLYIPFGAVQLRAQNPNAAKFPTAVVTDADIGVAKNRARALLTGGINDADLTINVDNGAAFASPSWGSIDQEFIKICSIAGNVITVCAGGRGAFAARPQRTSGATIIGPLLDQHVNQLAAEVKAIETALGTSFSGANAVKGAANLTGARANVCQCNGLAFIRSVPQQLIAAARFQYSFWADLASYLASNNNMLHAAHPEQFLDLRPLQRHNPDGPWGERLRMITLCISRIPEARLARAAGAF